MRAGKRNSLDLYNDLLILVADCVKNSETQQLLILNMKYFLEILYSTNSEERKALISPEIRDEAYSKIMCVHDKILARSSSNRIGEKTTYSSDDKELLQYYAEFISFIGVGKSTSIKVWSRKGSEITASNSSSSNHEDIWDENLCVLDKDYIKINRNDHVEFCANVYKNLKDMIISIDCHPNNIFFSMWQLECLMLDNKYQNENHITFQVDEKRTHTVSKTIRKFARIEESKLDFTDENPFLNFCSYLISSISNVEYQSVFISLYTLILTENYAIIQQIVPYFVYFALRFCENDETIDNITEFMKGLLQHGTYHQRMTIFSIVDFINICLVQDKASVRNFLISNKTAYCEKLFQLKFEMDQVDFQNDTISKLIEKLGKSKIIKYSFRTVSKMMQLLDNIPLNELSEIALKCREYKRAAIFFEEHVRQNINPQLSLESMTNFIEYSIDSDKVWMLIETYSKILPNDINKKELKHFTEVNILKESKSSEFLNSKLKYQEYQDHSSEVNERDQDFLNCIDDSNNKYINNMLRRGIESYFKLEDEDMTIECSQIWKEINTYFSCIDLNTIDLSSLNIDFESSKSFNTLENLFIMLISLMAEKVYNEGSCKFDFDTVNQFILQMINYLNFNLADLLVNSHGDKANQYKLFLHIVYEIKFVYSKYFINYKNNKEEFKLDSKDKEYLIIMFKERTEEFCIFENNYKHLCLIYSIRSYIFLLFKCLYEYCYFQTRKVSILVQINKSNFEKLNLFRHLEILKELIPDFEFEKAKFHRLIGEKCKAKDYLKENLQEITERFEFYKEDNEIPKQILNKNLIHDIWYFLFEIMIEIDPSFPKIEEEFYKYFSNQKNPTSEKMFVLYAAYIDYLNMIDRRKEKIYLNKDSSTLKLRNCVTYYFKSINSGCSLLWHTLPKILEIWFQLKDHEKPLKDEIERELIKLDTFKIVQILQILLSRFSLIKYRDTIVKLVSKVAAKYPLQSAWWLSHFKHFYSHSKSKHIVSADKNNRDWFVTKIVEQSIKLCSSNEECKLMEDDSKCQQERKVYEFERIFNATSDLMNALIKFGNEEIPIGGAEIPSEIRKIDFSKNHIIMPIYSNLKPYLPKPEDDFETFNCYNPEPVRITGVLKTCTVMESKDKPKKIGFIGSDNKFYYFLLKLDTSGDLRKEARFMSYAYLINTIFENDPECKSRNLNLQTYSIIPLSRSTGLIEWMLNTKTLKSSIWNKWSELSVKADLRSISKLKDAFKNGTVSNHWNLIMNTTKDVLWECLKERFPTSVGMFDCRTKFIYSYAAWCIVGYFIGLGDRHCDNILIHVNSGEVSHVDFDCIFEKGKKLNVAERVPFRLTRNITDILGVLREKCMFKKVCSVVWKAIKVNKQNVLGFLSSFIHDPIFEDKNSNLKGTPEEYLKRINEKISCIDVLLNNEQTKPINYNNEGFATSNYADELSMIDEQICMLIDQAMDKDILREMYYGWMPWM